MTTMQSSAVADICVVEPKVGPTQTMTVHISRDSAGGLAMWRAEPNPHHTWFSTAREIVLALVNERDSLSYQLSYAKGIISKDEFRACMGNYLWDPRSVPELERKTLMLAELVPELVDAELVSTVFQCEVVAAEAALARAVRQMTFSFAGPADSVRLALAQEKSGRR